MSKVKGKQIDTNFPTVVSCPELYAEVKHFRIVHPDKPGTDLVYSSLEGPENGVYCRGTGLTGELIRWPDHFTSITSLDTTTIQLTPIGGTVSLGVVELHRDGFIVASSTEQSSFFWHAYAARTDIAPLQVERPSREKKEQTPKRRSFSMWLFGLFG